MNELQVFGFENRQVRIIEKDGEPWFVAKDVCDILGLSDVSMSVSKLDDDERLVQKLFVSGQNRDVVTISEPGLYALVLRSNKPEAKAFSKWVRVEVIPSIRKTGAYALSGRESPDKGANYFAWEAAVGRVAENRIRTVLAQVMGRAALPEYRDISNIVDAHRTLSKVWSVIERLPKRTPTTETQRDKLLTLITKAKGFLEKEFRK